MDSVWVLLKSVCDRCTDRMWKGAEEHFSPPSDWPTELSRLEHRIFGVHLLHHAMTSLSHDNESWTQAMNYCVDHIEQEFASVEIEGNDFDDLVWERIQFYSECTQRAHAEGQPEQAEQRWVRALRLFLVAGWQAPPISLKPRIVLANPVHEAMLDISLIASFNCFYVDILLKPLLSVLQEHRNLLSLSPSQVESALIDASSGRRPIQQQVRSPSFFRRLFRGK